jgi:hypothetical protein
MRGGSGVFFHSRTPERVCEGISVKTANDKIAAAALCRGHVFWTLRLQSEATTAIWPRYFYSKGSSGAFHKYNVLSCLYSLALLPRSAFSLSRSVHSVRTRFDRPSSVMRWSTFGTKPYSTILSMRSRFSCLPFPARPNAAPRGYSLPGFFSSAEVCMRWH